MTKKCEIAKHQITTVKKGNNPFDIKLYRYLCIIRASVPLRRVCDNTESQIQTQLCIVKNKEKVMGKREERKRWHNTLKHRLRIAVNEPDGLTTLARQARKHWVLQL